MYAVVYLEMLDATGVCVVLQIETGRAHTFTK